MPEDQWTELEAVAAEGWKSKVLGDRRQEIVFLAPSIDKDGIVKLLDYCLVRELEMIVYVDKKPDIFVSFVDNMGVSTYPYFYRDIFILYLEFFCNTFF